MNEPNPHLVFVWDNFGPLHVDRVAATQNLLADRGRVTGVQMHSRSDTYGWDETAEVSSCRVETLFPQTKVKSVSELRIALASISKLLKIKATHVFLCHYDRLGTFLTACALRLLGVKVYVMGCPKFDDRPRTASREFIKQVALLPYQGALVGSSATEKFLRFLGFKYRKIVGGYNTVSVDRICQNASVTQLPFSDRDFIIVARLVEKKNHANIFRAFSRYISTSNDYQRCLHLCGDGPEEHSLRLLSAELGIEDRVVFHGFLQSDETSKIMSNSAALILVSNEEQFGNVVPEALALSLPIILSDVCGARYELLQQSVNGWFVEADNIDAIAWAMRETVACEAKWTMLREGANAMASKGDCARFAEGVERLIGDYRE